ncbi:mRNA decapping enzyme [Auricularia subglabra TFB-10046 SS5]|uniref:mRNA decapping enzyme n=1 Tax=Auricularia subglabra (strain TFB-10046 / SS5) TaxID=717982 RepID=J0LFR3_AURST|nr:mRNA decapping enzyme [Auricularia subglabra TFB-10046 SS5]
MAFGQGQDLSVLAAFKLKEIINEDPITHSATLLGTLPTGKDDERDQAIISLQKTAFDAEEVGRLDGLLSSVKLLESNDIYSWLLGSLKPRDAADLKINVIFPATEVHVRKYTRQNLVLVRETPELYTRIVEPYIVAFPPSRTEWVQNILAHKKEAHKVLYEEPAEDNKFGFLIIPDMKWDLVTISSLYLVALVHAPRGKALRSLRDLRSEHLPLLRSIKVQGARVAKERWGIQDGGLRVFVHYQPSYYHFHVHIVNANYTGLPGQSVGQAHLLDDIIALLELDGEIFTKLTLSYNLGEQHGLYVPMQAAQREVLSY